MPQIAHRRLRVARLSANLRSSYPRWMITDFRTTRSCKGLIFPPNRFPASPSILPKVSDGRLLGGIVGPCAKSRHADYTPAHDTKGELTGPWEMHGTWSLELNHRSSAADFYAVMTMELSDFAITEGLVGVEDPVTRSAHTHPSRSTAWCASSGNPLSRTMPVQRRVKFPDRSAAATKSKPIPKTFEDASLRWVHKSA